MGRVYKAHHVMMDRVVALKIIAPEIASNDRVVARFQREMKLVGRLDHPNVVRAFDADQIQKVLYIVMEYVPGHSLGERLKKGPIPPVEMVEYASQAAMGLAHAHEQGIVHRDIKPSNILLSGEGKIKILDLGLGVLMEADTSATFATADGIAVGTVDYMSPEQACGREVDGRSDVYGLGCAMYHLMTGKLPFPGTSPIERLGKRISGRHVPITEHLPDLPPQVVRVLDKMMAHKPHERFANAAELADALQGLIRPRARSPAAAAARAGAAARAVPGEAARVADGPAAPAGSAASREGPAEIPGMVCPAGAVCRDASAHCPRRWRSWPLALTFGAGLVLGLSLKMKAVAGVAAFNDAPAPAPAATRCSGALAYLALPREDLPQGAGEVRIAEVVAQVPAAWWGAPSGRWRSPWPLRRGPIWSNASGGPTGR